MSSVFKEGRAIAAACTDKTRRDILRARVDDCRETFDRFHISASREDFAELVARWTRMLLAIDAVAPMGGDGAPAGRMEAPKDTAADKAA